MNKLIRVADFIADFLADHHIHQVFSVTGGGAMHLNDALGKNKRLKCLYHHHEQACSMAAEGYARLSGNLAAVCVTTGPGGTNAITGVMGAYLDSVPMFVLSGQVKFQTTVASTNLPLRQLGDQEFAIVDTVKNLTKYSFMVTDPQSILYHLEKALYIATHGRPGPVWLDIPLDVQSALIDPNQLNHYNAIEDSTINPPKVSPETAQKVLARLKSAQRPVILAGYGIRAAHGFEEFLALANKLNIPICTPWNSHDLIWNDHPLFFGRPGNMGERVGNFVIQNSDCLLSIGSRLSIRQVSYNWEYFAREAYKIMVDIDPAELAKPTLNIDLPIHADAKDFMESLLNELQEDTLAPKESWLDWCNQIKQRFPIILDKFYEKESPVNPYCFMDKLFDILPEKQTIVAANGSCCVITFQSAFLKPGQRLFHNSGCASMGFALPAAIGATQVKPGEKIVCLEGDGSLQMNIQELQTIVHHNLPIIIYLINNNGYHSIRQTQNNFFGQPLVGVGPDSGVSFPDMEKIAYAYNIPFLRVEYLSELESKVAQAFAHDKGPIICEIITDSEQIFEPKLSSRKLNSGKMISAPLEDMAPFIDRQLFEDLMIVPPIEESEE